MSSGGISPRFGGQSSDTSPRAAPRRPTPPHESGFVETLANQASWGLRRIGLRGDPEESGFAVPAGRSPVPAIHETDSVVQLVARQESLEAAIEIAQALLAGQEPAAMWWLIAHRGRRLVRADAAVVRTVGEGGRTLVLRGQDPRHQGGHRPGILLLSEPIATGVCGPVYEAGRPSIISDVGAMYAAAQPRLAGAPENLEGQMPQGPGLIVPLGPKGDAIGTLMAVNQRGGRSFEKRDIDLLRSFAAPAVLAVQQAEARRERQRRMVVEERRRLARELHDDAIQSLRDISSGLASAADSSEDPVLREHMATLVRTLENVIQDLRNHIYGLRPSVLSGRTVEEALHQLVRDFEQQSGTTTVVEVETEAAERLRDQAGDLVQIVREALSNVWRHARAQRCRVFLGISGDDAWLIVEDDGVGFDPRHVQPNGYGLRSFRERVDRLRGRLDIESRPNMGTALRVSIPLGRRQ